MRDPVQVAGAKLGGLVRLNCAPERIREARQVLATAKLERAIDEAVAADPPVPAAARKALAARLRGAK